MRALQSRKQWIIDYDKAQQLLGDLEVLFEFFKSEEVTLEELEEQYLHVTIRIGFSLNDLWFIKRQYD